ncbi:uncharacterized protein CEXT_254451 [Caerostris extrusa]|uniref:Uncharacterized protein n=1 Tax=Caerostris extrusa TaxID=172846 RepID=A0AAV4SY78_CAEEX|nr:uncharacterized protein CEXT_254451 [Caerostris extrusa]
MAEEIYRENVWNSVSTQCEYIHEPSRDKTEKQIICFKSRKAWKFFKYIVFVLCTSCLIYQSVEFCAHYYTYPDAINFAVKSKIFTLPAVTVCDKNSKAETVIVTDEEYATFIKSASLQTSTLMMKKNQTLKIFCLLWGKGDRIFHYTLRMLREEEFHPWDLPQAFIAVHSPYVPSNPIADGSSMELGYEYELYVRLMCKELCTLKFSRDCFDCDRGLTMFRDHDKWCKEESNGLLVSVLYLRTESTCWFEAGSTRWLEGFRLVSKFEVPPTRKAKEENRNKISIRVYVKDPEIFVQSHTPLYGNWELFSYIGGLMGCWLGISRVDVRGHPRIQLPESSAVHQELQKKSRYYQMAALLVLQNGVSIKAVSIQKLPTETVQEPELGIGNHYQNASADIKSNCGGNGTCLFEKW